MPPPAAHAVEADREWTHMADFSRRDLLGAFAASVVALPQTDLSAQEQPAAPPVPVTFGYDDVVKRARDLATVPFDATPAALPDAVAKLDFDAWRDIRFRPDKSLLASTGGPFRLRAFHARVICSSAR